MQQTVSSQAFWRNAMDVPDFLREPKASQKEEAALISSKKSLLAMPGIKEMTEAREAWQDDRKADGAKFVELLIPMPPHLTGRDSCIQASSCRWMLSSSDKADRMETSSSTRSGQEKRGTVLRR